LSPFLAWAKVGGRNLGTSSYWPMKTLVMVIHTLQMIPLPTMVTIVTIVSPWFLTRCCSLCSTKRDGSLSRIHQIPIPPPRPPLPPICKNHVYSWVVQRFTGGSWPPFIGGWKVIYRWFKGSRAVHGWRPFIRGVGR
jgi:hypothetical protein